MSLMAQEELKDPVMDYYEMLKLDVNKLDTELAKTNQSIALLKVDLMRHVRAKRSSSYLKLIGAAGVITTTLLMQTDVITDGTVINACYGVSLGTMAAGWYIDLRSVKHLKRGPSLKERKRHEKWMEKHGFENPQIK